MARTITIEYAYRNKAEIGYNIWNQDAGRYEHIISFTYELRDGAKNLVQMQTVGHVIVVGDTMDTTAQADQKIAQSVSAWVAADKLLLAGYQD